MQGLCACCHGYTNLTKDFLCPECREAFINPVSPKLKALELNNEVGKAMRGLAGRHTPSLMGSTGRLRALAQMDRVEDAQESKTPLIVIQGQEKIERVLVDVRLNNLSLEETHHGEVD